MTAVVAAAAASLGGQSRRVRLQFRGELWRGRESLGSVARRGSIHQLSKYSSIRWRGQRRDALSGSCLGAKPRQRPARLAGGLETHSQLCVRGAGRVHAQLTVLGLMSRLASLTVTSPGLSFSKEATCWIDGRLVPFHISRFLPLIDEPDEDDDDNADDVVVAVDRPPLPGTFSTGWFARYSMAA